MGIGCLWLLTRLPLDTVLACGRSLGPLAIRLIPGRQRIVARNLRLAVPQLDHAAVAAQSSRHTGMSAAEMSWLWFRGADALERRFTVEGAEHVERALATGRGVILLQAHFTCIDVCASAICTRWPASAVYDPPKNPLFGAIQASARRRYVTGIIPNHDIRNMVRRLKRGEMVWFSPDQAVSARRGGIATRFFDQPVLTSSGTARILAMTGAVLIPLTPSRCDDGSGYRLRFDEAVDIDSSDVTAATQAVNDLLESQVHLQPGQYLWSHKRFKPPSKDYPDPYADIP